MDRGYDCGAAGMAGGVQVTDVASGDGNGDEDGQYLSATAPGQASEAVRLRPEAPGDSSCALVSAVEAAPPAQGEAPGKARPAKAVVYHSQNYKQQLLLIDVQALIDGASSAPDPLPHLVMQVIITGSETSIGNTRSRSMMKMAPAIGVGTEGMNTVQRPSP